MNALTSFAMFGKHDWTPWHPDPAVADALVAIPREQDRPQHPELLADEITVTDVEVTPGGWLDLRVFWSADWADIYGEYRFIAGELDGVLLTRDQTAALVGDDQLDRWAVEV